jgi:hypothetical protein
MPALSTRVEIHRDVLRRLAAARLAEFDTLRHTEPPHYAAALYLAGYAVEALLKCAICQALNLNELPVVFHLHDLEVLLFFSGRYTEIQASAAVWTSFRNIQMTWSEKRRYIDPSAVNEADCDQMNLWLNDPLSGVVPWLEARV